jgi:hypothetical protein
VPVLSVLQFQVCGLFVLSIVFAAVAAVIWSSRPPLPPPPAALLTQ